MTSAATDGLTRDIRRWVAEQINVPSQRLTFEVITGGRSNVTSRVLVDGRPRFVLREPPTGHLLPTAHDVLREHHILSALADSAVPVPQPIAARADAQRPCYLMNFVEGASLPDAAALRQWHGGTRLSVVARASAITLRTLHELDIARFSAVARSHEDYVGRQLQRWLQQWLAADAPVAAHAGRLHDELAARRPHGREPGEAQSIVHGDFHVANLLLTQQGGIAAVVDWELSTIGDPRADFGSFLAYLDRHLWSWRLSDLVMTERDRDEFGAVVDAYGDHDITGEDLAYYLAWAHWKLACIGEGVHARYAAGAVPDHASMDLRALAAAIRRHESAADRLLSPVATGMFASYLRPTKELRQ